MLSICLLFIKNQAQYAYKGYAYKKNVMQQTRYPLKEILIQQIAIFPKIIYLLRYSSHCKIVTKIIYLLAYSHCTILKFDLLNMSH